MSLAPINLRLMRKSAINGQGMGNLTPRRNTYLLKPHNRPGKLKQSEQGPLLVVAAAPIQPNAGCGKTEEDQKPGDYQWL